MFLPSDELLEVEMYKKIQQINMFHSLTIQNISVHLINYLIN